MILLGVQLAHLEGREPNGELVRLGQPNLRIKTSMHEPESPQPRCQILHRRTYPGLLQMGQETHAMAFIDASPIAKAARRILKKYEEAKLRPMTDGPLQLYIMRTYQ